MGYCKLIVYILGLQDFHVIIMILFRLSFICLMVFVNLMAQSVKTSATGVYSAKRHWLKPNLQPLLFISTVLLSLLSCYVY